MRTIVRRARVEVDVLYDPAVSPDPSDLQLDALAREGKDGSYSLIWRINSDRALTKKQAIRACQYQGTDPAFFFGEE